MSHDTLPDRLLSTEEAAEYLGVKKNTLEVWRSTGRYAIPYIKVGRSVRYRPSDLEAWIESQAQGVQNTAMTRTGDAAGMIG